jgi:cytochrome c oxidase accessory protein FixG
MSHPLDLHKERLATTDEEGNRIFMYPLEVRGFFRRWRTLVYFVLVWIFLALPWTKIHGVQTILLDIPGRRFSIFGMTFWAHDAPMMFFVLAGTAFSLVFAAAVWGRVWCGWMCPQTVFIDIIFRRIETWVEGDAHARRALDQANMSFQKFFKRLVKWTLFSFATLVITNSFLAYFVGADRMIQMIQGSPEANLIPFIFTLVFSLILLFNFGWFREQFCIIMCPYGRLQGILMDDRSWTVMYDAKRGEPRRGTGTPTGDCIDCYRCVAVCPTGIDIRRGQQLECIACTACIDACDEIMTKVKKPTGLIRYDRLTEKKDRSLFWRPTTVLYSVVLTIIFSGLIYTVATKEAVNATILRARGVPYAAGSENMIVNHFHLELNNSLFEPIEVWLQTADADAVDKSISITSAINPVIVGEGKTSRLDFFVSYPKTLLKFGHAKSNLRVLAKSKTGQYIIIKELPLVGPI